MVQVVVREGVRLAQTRIRLPAGLMVYQRAVRTEFIHTIPADK